jgi:hypothetical protein
MKLPDVAVVFDIEQLTALNNPFKYPVNLIFWKNELEITAEEVIVRVGLIAASPRNVNPFKIPSPTSTE